jgi:hypothetical protein
LEDVQARTNINAMQQLEHSFQFLELFKDVTTETLALLTHAMLSPTNASTPELFAEITTCVLSEVVQMEYATLLNKETVMTTTFALKTAVTKNSDVNTNQRIAKMETNVQLIFALMIRDASTSTNHVMTRIHVLLILAILLQDNVYLLLYHALTLMHVQLIAAMFQPETA